MNVCSLNKKLFTERKCMCSTGVFCTARVAEMIRVHSTSKVNDYHSWPSASSATVYRRIW